MDTELVIEVLQVVGGLAGMLAALFQLRKARLEAERRAAPPEPVRIAPEAPGERADVVPAVEAALIGLRAEGYWKRFRAFEARGAERFTPSFHFIAFLLGGFWFLYRKVYGAGVLLLAAQAGALATTRVYAGTDVAPFAAGAVLLLSLTAAFTANYVYFRSVARRAKELRARARGDEAKAAELARRVGGVSRGALVLAVVVFALVIATTVILSDDVLYNRTRRLFRRAWRAIRRAL